jgi:hypothetical protein
MDNKLNEIRRKIKILRQVMLGAEDDIRKQVDRDEDCSEAAVHLMSMRVVMLGLISERNRLGGEERLLDVDERLKLDVRAGSRKPSSAAPASASYIRQAKHPKPHAALAATAKARGRRER